MAKILLPAEGVPLHKIVQEMSINGDEPPPQFFVKDSSLGVTDSSPPVSVPIIDIGLLSTEEELEKLKLALSSEGCFQAIGHGIPSSFLDKVREIALQFFALPMEERQKYSRAVNESEGYGCDTIVSEKQVLDWSHRLCLKVAPEDKRRLNLWPANPNDFKEILDEYPMKIKNVTDILFKAMARSLNLEEKSFLKLFGDRQLIEARFNFYPPCSRPDVVLGLKPHTDRSGITVLLQDREVEGLQIYIDDKWVKVPVVPDALFVNLGDQMQIISNGIFKSPLHRVVTNSERLRISVAMINEPEPENEIGPVDSLVNEQRPRLYKNVKNYGTVNYVCYQKGQVAIDTVRI